MPDSFDELKPYRSLLLASVRARVRVRPLVNRILDDVQTIVEDGTALNFGSRLNDSAQGRIHAGFLHYVEQRAPGWSAEGVTDTLNQLVVVCRLRRLVAFYVSDTRMRKALKSRFGDSTFPGFKVLEPVPRGRLNAAFLQGPTRTLWLSGPHRCGVDGEAATAEVADLHAEALQHLRSPRWVKIRYESGHTLSDGVIFEQRHRDMPFQGFSFVDVSAFDVKKEKPNPITEVGTGQDSLFDWTHRFWPNLDGTQKLPGGFLISDDGTMEIADFVHLDQTDDVPVVSLIHVKAAGSDSSNRGISVSSYEVVTGQAVKNLRFMDQLILADGLADGLGRAISGVAFHDRNPSTRQEMIDALRSIGSNYRRRVVIVQPHVTRTRHDAARANPDSSDAARLRQLDTLLLGAEANANALGAEFMVVTSE